MASLKSKRLHSGLTTWWERTRLNREKVVQEARGGIAGGRQEVRPSSAVATGRPGQPFYCSSRRGRSAVTEPSVRWDIMIEQEIHTWSFPPVPAKDLQKLW